MKKIFFIVAVFMWGLPLQSQIREVLNQGSVSYVTGNNIYVKFSETKTIEPGDTLFRKEKNQWIPSLIVKQKSSISCVCTLVESEAPEKGTQIFYLRTYKVDIDTDPIEEIDAAIDTVKPLPEIKAIPADGNIDDDLELDPPPELKQKLIGRISAASYSTLSARDPNHRMRYAMSFRGENINHSRFSAETYLTFRHTLGQWNDVEENIYDALKVISMAVRYESTHQASIILGRRINPRISSMGAVDGIQLEKTLGNFQFGALAGTRPDYMDFRFNPTLFQSGAYVGYTKQKAGASQMNTLGFIEQRNAGAVDRRFIYFQHMDNLWKDLQVFASFEVDLYQKVNEKISNNARLTNLYTSLRYRFSKKFSLSVSYDNRKNVIFFESFKSYIDQLIEQETRQGLRFNISYRPFKLISWGANASWRFQKSQVNNSRNVNSYITFSRVPLVKGSLSLNINLLETGFLKSTLWGVRYSRDILPGKLSGDLSYRRVAYQYQQYEYKTIQDIAGCSLNWNITRKLGMYLYYEGAFDKRYDTISRINTKLIQRF